MADPSGHLGARPITLEYAPTARGVTAARVLAKTASVFTGLAAIIFAVSGLFTFLAGCLTGGRAGSEVCFVGLIVLALSAGCLFATDRLSRIR
jgi:hypothetical protein